MCLHLTSFRLTWRHSKSLRCHMQVCEKTMQIPEFCPKVFFYKIFSIAAFCCEPPKLETVLQALFVRNPNSFLWAIKCVKIKHPFQLRNAPKHIQVHRKFMAVNGNMFSKQLAKVSMNTTGCDEIQWRVSVTLKKRRKLTAFKEPYRTGTRAAREVYAWRSLYHRVSKPRTF